MIPYELVDGRGERLLSDWDLDGREQRALNTLLLVLSQTDFEQARNSVIFKIGGHVDIYYSKATGRTQLRPRCCLGPDRPRDEVTYLVRAKERDRKTIPRDANARASVKLEELIVGRCLRTACQLKQATTGVKS